MPKSWKLLGVGVVAAGTYAAWRAFESRRIDTDVRWQAQPFPYPPVPLGSSGPATSAEPSAWVEPDDSVCPAGHPVKAKLASGIFHVPGGASYERTRPDRCYASAESAEADGLRAANR